MTRAGDGMTSELFEDVEEETEDPASAIINPFDPEDIDVVTRQPNVNLLLSRLNSDRLDLEPDFQRKSGIWNAQRMSRLIESLLLKIPLPTMYAAESQGGDDRWIIVDGVQRISTIASFVNPKLVPKLNFSKLVGLEYLDEYEGYTYEDLSPRLQTRIQETEFILNLIRRGTPEPVMFNIFARINTGGAPLTRQELRHALTPGEGRVLLKELAESPSFKKATGGRVRNDRMEDREMILRFIAFHLVGVDSYTRTTDFDGFLTAALKNLSSLGAKRRATIGRRFDRSLATATQVFGIHAFRKSLPGDERRAPINKALFEAVLVALAGLTLPQQRAVVGRSDLIVKRFRRLLDDPDFVAAVSQGTGDYRKVQLRHDRVSKAFA
jgi:hypothetical protein